MESNADENYKNNTSYRYLTSGNSSDEDIDLKDVVVRNPRHSSILLADEGDGSEADLLGTTPPRSRIRNKERRRTNIESDFHLQKNLRPKRYSSDNLLKADSSIPIAERLKKRASLKLYRSKERDFKQDMSHRESRVEPPGQGAMPAVPTLVESCSRFMSLTSKLKCRNVSESEEVEPRWQEEEAPPNRVSFHNTFSMLINMGNIDKGCRRTISREEQVWQNELKDLIWLELQAKIAGRSLAQQDAYLCSQRNIVPAVVQNIIDYRFVNPNPCRNRVTRLTSVAGSREDLASDTDTKEDCAKEDEESIAAGCLSLSCEQCSEAVGAAMRELNALLDAYYSALALYPSCKAMTVDHPLVATSLFQNRIKAMCLWYNTALHMRLKVLAVRRVMCTLRRTGEPPYQKQFSRQSSECNRQCRVRFDVSNNPSDSSNSEYSTHSETNEVGGTDVGDVSRNENLEKEDVAQKEDEVDCGLRSEGTVDSIGQLTPEIGRDKYSSSDTQMSGESGYASAGTEPVYRVGTLAAVSRLRLLGKCDVSPFRDYHCEMLKTQGVRRCMMFINKLRKNVLHKVHQTLEKPDGENPDSFQEDETVEVFLDTKDPDDKTDDTPEDELTDAYELRRYGCWSEESIAMRLPSYRNHFLALSSVCMEAVHDYLSLRLETRPERPSCLTVKQLINELKEGLDISTEMRSDFVRNVRAALHGRPVQATACAELLQLLQAYDHTVETVLKQYLSYLRTMSSTERLGRAALRAEWAFTGRLARRVRCARLLAPEAFADIACNQITRLLDEFKGKFDELVKLEKTQQSKRPDRYSAYEMCRAVQEIFARGREPLLHTAQWARALAARLARRPPAFAAHRTRILSMLMSMRDYVVEHTRLVLERTSVPDEELQLTEGLVTRVRVLLLLMFKLGFELHKELFKLVASPRREECRRSRPASMQLLRQPVPLQTRRRPETIIVHEATNLSIHKELHRVVNEASRSPVSSRRVAGGSPPRPARFKLARSESINEDAIFDDRLFDTLNHYGEGQGDACIERLLSGGEVSEGPTLLESGEAETQSDAEALGLEQEWAARVARNIIEFARCWMNFVVQRCDRGRGLRPRWASQGLEFLMLACDPCNTKHLTEEEFEELKARMDGCISHVVGSRPPARDNAPRSRPQLHSPSPGSPRAVPGKEMPPPPSPPTELDPSLTFPVFDAQARKKRVLEAVSQLEEQRDDKLRELKAVGRVVSRSVASYEPKLRQLTFKWQRGLKIGAGTFGKVYTVVNTESGQLLAMKELSVGAGDRRALQRAANELQVLEGVRHPHLVRYYGCELHREEMLLFMELCVEGSLEALVATAGALAEPSVRRYTAQLVSAVAELHARNIAHRDIKSGNIFLTNEGHCLKLGDFGCAVKIRANTTAPGELQGFVGTQAYMAPEVFMKSSGHGRAADIWSLGCVVTEMASGKRPFSEYDSNYQIMFVVGMGGRPDIPPSLSEEGRSFCLSCLTHDPDERPRAQQLSLHHFLMVKPDDEDCNCEPAYLMT